jgi:DNA-binding phage protein
MGKTKVTAKARKVKTRADIKTIPWDAAEYLKSEEDMANYLEAAGLGRESLYKALSADGNPEFATVLKVVQALGLRLRVSV